MSDKTHGKGQALRNNKSFFADADIKHIKEKKHENLAFQIEINDFKFFDPI